MFMSPNDSAFKFQLSTPIALRPSLHNMNYSEFGERGVGAPGDRDGMVGLLLCWRSVRVRGACGDRLYVAGA